MGKWERRGYFHCTREKMLNWKLVEGKKISYFGQIFTPATSSSSLGDLFKPYRGFTNFQLFITLELSVQPQRRLVQTMHKKKQLSVKYVNRRLQLKPIFEVFF